jgi:hypothetical protein
MKTQTQLPLVVQKTIQAAIRQLEAAGCEFRVNAPDGKSYGTLKVEEPKKKKMNPDREYGELRAYYDQYMKYNVAVGDVVEIPHSPKYTPEEIRGGICAKLTSRWGKGTYTTAITKAGTVQILRTA